MKTYTLSPSPAGKGGEEEDGLGLIASVLLSYVVSVLLAVFYPKPSQQEWALDASRRGWSQWMIRFTRATQFFTLYSMLMVIAALITESREIAVVASVLEGMVFLLYHGICSYDAKLLAYDRHDIVEMCTGWLPPMNRYVFVWVGLHIQHTLVPTLLWSTVKHYPEDEWLVLLALTVYLALNHLCWLVQGHPAYPIQEILYGKGRHVYYGSVFLVYLACLLVCQTLDFLF
jgi:hypothetical protein